MRSIDCQHPPLLRPPFAPRRYLCQLAPPLPSTMIRFYFREAVFSLSSFLAPLHYFFYLLCFYRFYSESRSPFSVMAQLFVYMGSKERFLMLRCHWRTRGWRTYGAEIASDIRDVQSHGNVLHGKISYGIGIFGTENRRMKRNAG